MAKFSSSTFGTISGRHGTAVAVTYKNGKSILRLYRKPANPNTPKQLANRTKFSVVNKALTPLREIIKTGYRDTAAFPKVAGKALGEAVIGEYPDFSIDFSKIQIATGTLQTAEKATAKLSAEMFGIDLTWDTTIGFQPSMGNENDTVNVICFNKNSQLALSFNGVAMRKEGLAVITLPEIWQGTDLHCWIYLTSADNLSHSNSTYVSLISV